MWPIMCQCIRYYLKQYLYLHGAHCIVTVCTL